MSTNISRRTLAKGAAWSAPVVAASAAVPAYAASPAVCTDEAKKAIDDAFTEVSSTMFTAYWTEATRGSLNGVSKVPSFNIINNSKYTVHLSEEENQGLIVEFAAVRANGNEDAPNGPISAATSWGTTSAVSTDRKVNGQWSRIWTWNANGTTLPGNYGNSTDNMADTNFSTGTTVGGINVAATLVQAPVLYPELESIQIISGLDLSACAAYHAQKVALVEPVTMLFAGPNVEGTAQAPWNHNNGEYFLDGSYYTWSQGTTVWSGSAGNYLSDVFPPGSTGIAEYFDGIF